ncbi:MAG: hypothetical protein NTW95_05815 [Candidatus Aminicenantes bacterium]|nr:hypothetical protein [Candidatus Aminicenantes bacterium]
MVDNVGYTSSIYTYEAQETPDWTGDVGVGLRASAIVANRLILQAEDLPIYSFYLTNKDLRTWGNRFKAAAYSYIGPFNLKAGYSRNDLHQRPNLEFSRPYRYSDREWSEEVDFGRDSSLFLTAYGRFKQLQYDEALYADAYNLADRLDHHENTFGLRLNKVVFTRTLLFINYELTNYVFTAGSERDSRAQGMYLGAQFPEMGMLQGSFQIGMNQFDPGNPLYKSVSRPSGRGDVHLTLMERLRISVFYELQTYFSYYSNDLFYNNQSFGGGAELYLTSFLKGGATYQDGRLKYFSFLDLQLQRSDRVRQQRYYLAVPLFGSMSLGFAYNIYRLRSDVLNLDYTRSFWGGFISYGF